MTHEYRCASSRIYLCWPVWDVCRLSAQHVLIWTWVPLQPTGGMCIKRQRMKPVAASDTSLLQSRALGSQSCVQLGVSRQWRVWPARLAVSPAPLGPTAVEPASRLRLDRAATVSQSVHVIWSSCVFKMNGLRSWLFDGFLCFVFLVRSIGYWCPPGQSAATALPCPPGHFCSQGSAAPEPCPSGTYQDRERQASCTICEAGGSHSH